MVSLTFYGGVDEIGGNKVLLEGGGSRIFLDFGQSFSLLDDYFSEWLQPRPRFGLRDYLAFNLVPKLSGLYSREVLEKTSLRYRKPEFDGVLISHAHFDHTSHLRFLDAGIPIYLGGATKLIMESVQETSNNAGFFTEESAIKTFRTGMNFSIGEFRVHPIHVDHSVPGAYGFVIEAPGANIAYSGDLRKHGPHAEMTEDFLEKAAEFRPDVLLMEGTRVTERETRKNHSEAAVKSGSAEVARNTKGLILAMRYPRDIDRFKTFYSVAKETGKKLVISIKTARLLMALEKSSLKPPKPFSDRNILVYKREMNKYKAWEQELLPKCVDSDYVSEHQGNCILELDFAQLNELVDIKPKGGACIHSMSEPFDEDPLSQIADDVLHNWAREFSMEYHQLHASGHVSMAEIGQFIGRIRPKKVIPIHTEHAELFRKLAPNVRLVKKGEKIRV